MQLYELRDVISLLRAEVKRAGGQAPWAKEHGISRVSVNKTLNGQRSPSPKIIKALKLRIVFLAEAKAQHPAPR